MRFFICLLLIAFVECDNGKPRVRQFKNAILMQDHYIPDNPWFGGEWNDFSWSDPERWYKKIDYYDDIEEDSFIKLDYTMQRLNSGWFSDSWDHMFDDSVYLCDTSEKTQNATMIGLIRHLLGISQGCPIEEDYEADVSNIHFPIHNFEMYWNYDIRDVTIRVLINMWDNNKSPANKLLTGTIYIQEKDGGYELLKN